MNSPLASVSLDSSAVLRIALGASPGWAAISTIDGLYYTDPFEPSLKPGEPLMLGAWCSSSAGCILGNEQIFAVERVPN